MFNINLPMITIILIASIATMIPRFIPYFTPLIDKIPNSIKEMLKILPIAALGALIFPFCLIDFNPLWIAGLIGVLIAFIFGYLRFNMIISIILSVVATYLLLMLL
ncbi:MAG: AzlD domain-containing protein [Pleomorphochaeta sp.]